MGYNANNQFAKKLSSPELREEAYKQYCDHLAAGYSKKSWVFEHPELTLTWETMEKYIKNENEFDPLKKKIAESRGYGHWEKVVHDSAKGANKDANTATLQMLMRNKYGWDRKDQIQEDDDSQTVQSCDNILSQLAALQVQQKAGSFTYTEIKKA